MCVRSPAATWTRSRCNPGNAPTTAANSNRKQTRSAPPASGNCAVNSFKKSSICVPIVGPEL